MARERAKSFAEALLAFEREGNLEALVELFADDCELSNVATPRVFRGKDGARQFWRAYHGLLKDVRSEFRNVIEAQDRAALEWRTEGTASTGEQVRYEGTSVLEFVGDKVKRFVAYFDPNKLGLELTEDLGTLDVASSATNQPLQGQSAVEGP